jgi:hypothetical protein
MGVVALAFLFVGTGCSSGARYTADEERVAQGYLPTVARVSYHPDSVRQLHIVETEDQIQLKLEESFASIVRRWSSTWRGSGAGRLRNATSLRTFATLWSQELSLAVLQAERGINGLSKSLARQLIAERRAEYDSLIQIDVYRFVGSPETGGGLSQTWLERAGTRIVLRDGNDRSYRPTRIESSNLQDGFSARGSTVPFRRNFIYFKRVVDGRDILEDTDQLRLEVRGIGDGAGYHFRWFFNDERTAQSGQS